MLSWIPRKFEIPPWGESVGFGTAIVNVYRNYSPYGKKSFVMPDLGFHRGLESYYLSCVVSLFLINASFLLSFSMDEV